MHCVRTQYCACHLIGTRNVVNYEIGLSVFDSHTGESSS